MDIRRWLFLLLAICQTLIHGDLTWRCLKSLPIILGNYLMRSFELNTSLWILLTDLFLLEREPWARTFRGRGLLGILGKLLEAFPGVNIPLPWTQAMHLLVPQSQLDLVSYLNLCGKTVLSLHCFITTRLVIVLDLNGTLWNVYDIDQVKDI